MLELAHPWLLVLLPLPIVAWLLLPPYRQTVSAVRVPFFTTVTDAAGARSGTGSVVVARNRLQKVILTSIWILVIFGLAKPEWIGEPITRTEAARDIMLAIDLSGSMDYVDFEDQQGVARRRLDAVKEVVDEFIADRQDDRIGLIVFGNRAYLQLPFTRDITTARQMVALTDVGMAGPRTAIGDAIGLAINSFEESQVDQRLLILLTDGNDTASKMTPLNAAAIAATSGVEIFTIGVGDPQATGEDRVDFDALLNISKRTGGQFFEADNAAALASIYRRIDELVPAEAKTQSWRPRESLVHLPLAVIVMMTVVGYLAGLWRLQRD